MKRHAWFWFGAVVLVAGGLTACATESAAAKPSAAAQAPATAEAAPPPVATEAVDAGTATEVATAKPEDTKAEVKPAEETKSPPADTKKPDEKKLVETKAEAKQPEAKKPEEPKAEVKKGAYALVPVATPDKKTERQWKSKCSSCHGMDGKAGTEKGHAMKMEDFTQASWQTAHGTDELKKTVKDGLKRTRGGVKQEMDGFSADLTADQIDALVQYVRWLGAPK